MSRVRISFHPEINICCFSTELQRTFFPPTYQDAECTRRLQPGDQRVWTALKVFVELRDDTTLHIPFREASKVSDDSAVVRFFITGTDNLLGVRIGSGTRLACHGRRSGSLL